MSAPEVCGGDFHHFNSPHSTRPRRSAPYTPSALLLPAPDSCFREGLLYCPVLTPGKVNYVSPLFNCLA